MGSASEVASFFGGFPTTLVALVFLVTFATLVYLVSLASLGGLAALIALKRSKTLMGSVSYVFSGTVRCYQELSGVL